MRTRDWRRFQEEKIYRRRIKRFGRAWYYFHTANGDKLKNPIWVDFIGLPDYNFYKTGTTKKYDTKVKLNTHQTRVIHITEIVKRDKIVMEIEKKTIN
jgi:hypothetical protein